MMMEKYIILAAFCCIIYFWSVMSVILTLETVLVGRNSGRNNTNLCCQNPDL